MDSTVTADNIINTVKECSSLVQSVVIFDVFAGSGVPEGKKSIAFSVVLQSNDRTLEEADITGFSDNVVKVLAEKLNAVLRD